MNMGIGGSALATSVVSTSQSNTKRMLGVTKTESGYHVSINPSSLTLLQVCPKKAFYALHRGLVSKEPGLATTFGSAIHKFLEIFYLTPRAERTLPPNYKEMIMRMCQGQNLSDESHFIYRATRGFIEVAAPLANLPSEDKRSLFNGGYLLGEYCESRIDDPYEVYFHNNTPCIEMLVETPIHAEPGLTIDLFGTIDAILINRANNQIVECDHKTTSATNMNDFYNRTKPNLQYDAYVYLAQHAMGLNIENFMINCFQVKSMPKTSRGTGPNFLHIITKRTPEDLELFKHTLIYYVKQYIHWTETEFWPLGSVDACANYGACGYLKLCNSPEIIRENIISADYEVKNG